MFGSFDLLEFMNKVAMIYLPLLFSLCFHELAHGYVAKLRGDRTAQMMGRLTMNPLAHIDWFGTVAMPLFSLAANLNIFFGWAKPVPVNSRNLRSPKQDMFWIALAGPLSNIFLAFVGTGALWLAARFLGATEFYRPVGRLMDAFILTNLFLAFFNLIPLHPLDGGKVLARFLPAAWSYKLEQNEQLTSLLLMILIFSGATHFLIRPVLIFYTILRDWALL